MQAAANLHLPGGSWSYLYLCVSPVQAGSGLDRRCRSPIAVRWEEDRPEWQLASVAGQAALGLAVLLSLSPGEEGTAKCSVIRDV